MAISVVMPALEMAQETGKLVSWLKKEGDSVAKGEPLLEIETDKAVMEIEAQADGILAGIKASPGQEIPVGQTIAWIVAPGEAVPAEDAGGNAVPTARATSTKVETPVAASAAAPVSSTPTTAKISPKARRLAKELGVDISLVHGSGPGGEILADDVQAAGARTGSASARVPLPSRRVLPRGHWKLPPLSVALWPSGQRRAGLPCRISSSRETLTPPD